MALKAGRPTGRTKEHIENGKNKLVSEESEKNSENIEFKSNHKDFEERLEKLENETIFLKSEIKSLRSQIQTKEKERKPINAHIESIKEAMSKKLSGFLK